MTDFITPPTNFPFKPGEAVCWLPATHRMTLPPPRIHAIVMGEPYGMTTVRFSDGRQGHVNTTNLAYRAYCAHCNTPAVMTTRGRLVCAGCGGPVIETPPPDEMVVLRFPLDSGWYTSMTMHRAIVNGWTYRQAIHDRDATIERAVQRMLRQLGLAKPVCRTNQDYRIAERLKFYAMLEHEAGFLATYYELCGQPVAFVPLAA